MTLLAFLVALIAGYLWWLIMGTSVIVAGGMTIYNAAMGFVAASAVLCGIVHAARTANLKPAVSASILCLLIVYGFNIAWLYGPPGLLHGWIYAIVGACFLGLGGERFQHVIGGLLVTMSLASFANVLGMFPVRPRVFTGFYYADFIAYGMHASFVIAGAAADDGLADWIRRFGWDRSRRLSVLDVRSPNHRGNQEVGS